MIVTFVLSVFWIVSGILGIVFGIQKTIPRKFRNTEYEKPYIRFMGFAQLMVGLSGFGIWLLAENKIIPSEQLVVTAALCCIPSILFAILGDLYFRKRLGK